MKKAIIILLIFGVMILGISATAHAQWWQKKSTIAKLKLTERQIQEMSRIYNDSSERRIDLSSQGRKLQLQLNNLMNAEKLLVKALEKRVGLVKLKAEKVASQIAMKQVNCSICEDGRIVNHMEESYGKSNNRSK